MGSSMPQMNGSIWRKVEGAKERKGKVLRNNFE
jgi:hypothetical protein